MSIDPVGLADAAGVSALPSLPTLTATAPVSGPDEDFGALVTSNLQKLEGMHDGTDRLAVQAATGDLQDIHDYMIASTETSVATELTIAVRNKAVEAFTEIMRMQV
jgi:flagellar hook-basal body complex protein FliE